MKYEVRLIRGIGAVVLLFCFVSLGSGCEALIKKFKRTPTQQRARETDMILEPHSYDAAAVSREELIRQYYVFWNSWHDELIRSLQEGSNPRKQVESAREAGLNLANLAAVARQEHKDLLEGYSKRLGELKEELVRDIHGMYRYRHLRTAERLKRQIKKKFPASRAAELLI